MKSLINILMVWLMTLVLPMQGFAAVDMMSCEKPHAPHMQESSHGHCHEDAAPVTHLHVQTQQVDSKHACQHCAKCAACCSSVTLLTSTDIPTNPLYVTGSGPCYLARVFISHIPSGLERPPRATLTSAIPG